MPLPYTIVLFGSSGFIGRNIAHYYYRRSPYHIIGFARADADLTKSKSIPTVLSKLDHPPKPVIIFAATANTPSLKPQSIMRANILMATNLVELISSLTCAHIIYLSSVDVYGHSNLKLPLSESSPLKPASHYAASKLISELIITDECARRNIPVAILRLPGVYGPGDNSNRIIPSVIRATRHGQTLTINGDGTQRRDLLYAPDIARLAGHIIRHRISGTFNAVTGHSCAVNEVIRMIETIIGKGINKVYRCDPQQHDLMFKPSRILKKIRNFRFTEISRGLQLAMRSKYRLLHD